MYKGDAETNHDNDKFSADLQKVVMLPRMTGIKTVVFIKRITDYNETFTPLGTKERYPKETLPFAVCGMKVDITKRDADDISSAFVKWLMNEEMRKKEKLRNPHQPRNCCCS